MPSKAIIIINPKAGSSRAGPMCHRLQKSLAQMGYEVHIQPTARAGHARQLAQEAAKDAVTLVAAVGGDGTVAEVANGLAYSNVTLLVVPAGTENIIATELGLSNNTAQLDILLSRGKAQPVDMGCVNGRYFLAILGAGFDADVIHRVHKNRQGHISHLSYFWPIWRTFWEYRFPALHVVADGELVCDAPALVFVGNMARYAVGLRILRDASFDDGLLDLCVYPCRRQVRLVLHSANTMLKIHPERRSVIYRQCRNIEISSSPSVRMQVDGDPGGHLPAKIEVCPGALNVLMMPD